MCGRSLRRVKAWLTRTARREEDQTISRLQAQQAEAARAVVRTSTADGVVSKHYEGAEKYEGELLTAEPKREPETPQRSQPVEEPRKPKKPCGRATHIDQLLQAKRKKTGPRRRQRGHR